MSIHIRFESMLALATLLACGPIWADTQPTTSMSAFKPSADCSTHENYDPAWASHGEDYGFGQTPGKEAHGIAGFYQLRSHGGKLYAAFGGAAKPGVTPGALLVLDADTLTLDRAIALPANANALALNAAGSVAVVTHTRANGFSIVDLRSGNVRCRLPDTTIDGKAYTGRYVAFDAQDNFYINYHSSWRADEARAVVLKYDLRGEHASKAVQVVEHSHSMPLLFQGGHLLTGSHGLKSVNASTGQTGALASENRNANIFNYAPGPGGTLLASNQGYDGRPNLLLIDPATNTQSATFTGRGSVEVAYVPARGQVFSTNFDSKTVTVAALPSDATGLMPGRFVNIRFDGNPATLHARETPGATEVFVAVKYWGEDNLSKAGRLHKIRIANTVRGIDGIKQPGACTVTTFDLAHRSVSKPEPCDLLDAQATYALEHERVRNTILQWTKLQQEAADKLAAARAVLVQSGDVPGTVAEADVSQAKETIDTREYQLKYLDGQLSAARVNLDVLGRLGRP